MAFFKKKKVVPHVRLTGIIGSGGRFKQGLELANQKDILKKISSYVPAGQDWVVKENVSFKDYKPFGLLGTLELKKKYEKIVPHDETDIDEADGCWDGYKKVGMKKKGKKMVPNCVPEENIEEGEKKKSETWEAGFKRRVVKTTKPEHKEKGYNWRIKGKERPEVTIKLYKSKPDFAEFKKQMKKGEVTRWSRKIKK